MKQLGHEVVEPSIQNYYPDYSLVKSVVSDDVQKAGPEFTLAVSVFLALLTHLGVISGGLAVSKAENALQYNIKTFSVFD